VAYDEETKKSGILAGTGVRNLLFDLRELMSTTVTADTEGDITSMYKVGMEFDRDGTLTLDSEALTAALADNPEGVQAFFLGDDTRKIEGFADQINERIRVLTSTAGLVETEKSAAQDRIAGLKVQIEGETERLDRKYERMTRQFIELDKYMNQMSSISSFLTSQLSSLSQRGNGNGN
jgi:flagellar hook-associated protein 2